ncbi:MAG: M23 family metallopeptidase, partial [Oscillospiraceae bacterium]
MITRIPFNGKFRVTGAYWQTSGYWSPSKPHTGIDLVGDDNRSVYSTTVGTVALAGAMGNGWGKCVYINDDTYTHLFAHLDSIDVLVGDKVTYTTKLGVMGSTGNVTGAHTHYELRKYSNEGKHTDINTGTRYSIYDVAEYMGIPNVK